jgi:spermidine/putrescine transport system substrate-binding protein
VPALQHPTFDPNRDFSVPWQSGMTGLIVREDLAPDVHSICDLFNPKYKGKVEMLTEMRDTVPLVMKCMGVDLSKATEQDWLNAIAKIKSAADSGQIRRFTGNDYARDLTSGDVDAVIGWSGDAVQLQADNPNIKFVMPKEGCMLWSDNMEIPVGAPNPTAAEAWMNYVYDPKNQAQIAAYNNYVTPVAGVKQVFEKTDPATAKNPLIFPSSKFTANCDTAPTLSGQEEQKVTAAFDAVING